MVDSSTRAENIKDEARISCVRNKRWLKKIEDSLSKGPWSQLKEFPMAKDGTI